MTALAGDMIALSGRRVGSFTGQVLGPEWGAWGSRAVLGVGAVGGGTAFALLCFVSVRHQIGPLPDGRQDHISPLAPTTKPSERLRTFAILLLRSAAYAVHVYYGERVWSSLLSGRMSSLTDHPEKTVRVGSRPLSIDFAQILFTSVFLTVLSFFLRPAPASTSLVDHIYTFLSSRFLRPPPTPSCPSCPPSSHGRSSPSSYFYDYPF